MDKNLTQFTDQKYLNLETFRKSGEAVRTPVWFVVDPDTGKYYVRTGRNSGKVKRAINNSQVNIMPCGQSGELLGTWVAAQASEVSDGTTAGLVRKLLVEKYGDMVAMMEARVQSSGQEYTILMIEPGV